MFDNEEIEQVIGDEDTFEEDVDIFYVFQQTWDIFEAGQPLSSKRMIAYRHSLSPKLILDISTPPPEC